MFSTFSSFGLLFLSAAICQVECSQYFFQPGYIASSEEISSKAMTIQDASKACDADAACKGFTLQRNRNDTSATTFIRLLSGAESYVVYDPAWLSYTKVASRGPSYFWQEGYLGHGEELHDEYMTLLKAKEWCDEQKACAGFTYEQSSDQKQEFHVRFKSEPVVTSSEKYMSYVKAGTMAGPENAYTYQPGFIGGEDPIHSGFMNLHYAKVYCDGDKKCNGFMVNRKVYQAAQEVFISFFGSTKVTFSSEWDSYTREKPREEL
ncbi:hypothetical protein CYMTET_17680 [Cymbomonas tetramitiformis]|uniref:Uncharacterized protein n=1 Tax=Cymbomonas tetramitiformis TaxID=36881 RepID=A0AAE0G9L3_9CHLO|nr:hypothetical protein CYMTET_17680 [Cymbomonas tetramitiformis]